MAKRFKKNWGIRKEPEYFEKYKHMRLSKKDVFIRKTIDLLSQVYEIICSFFSNLFHKIYTSSLVTSIIDKVQSLIQLIFNKNSHLRHCEDNKGKIIDFNQAKRIRDSLEPDNNSRSGKRFKKTDKSDDYNVKRIKPSINFENNSNKRVKKTFDFESKKISGEGIKYSFEKVISEIKYKIPFINKPIITADNLPTTEQFESELNRIRNKSRNNSFLRNLIFSLITVSAVVVLIAIYILPVFQIYGTSMQPTLKEGDIVVSVKGSEFERGDIVSFYYNNKILVKRVIAFEGDFVRIDEDGTIYVNNKKLSEPYIDQKALGDCDIDMPYQVPAGKIFVLGDARATSIDSRNTVMGCIAEEQIIGEIIFQIWPFESFGTM